MSSLNIYKSDSTNNYGTFTTNLSNFLTSSGFISYKSGSDIGYIGNVSSTSMSDVALNDISVTSASSIFFYFNNLGQTSLIYVYTCYDKSTNTYRIVLIPVVGYTAFFSDDSKKYVLFKLDNKYAYSSDFRAMTYETDTTKYMSLGESGRSISISTHVFKSIDDPEITKTVIIVTDVDGYVSFYDSLSPYPWHVENTYHNGENVGKSNSINAYKYSANGYYCDDIYYFDGGYDMPGEGVITMAKFKFLRLGYSNLFIKME